MENFKNKKELGFGLVIFSIIVGALSYTAGQSVGYDEAKATFLDSAYLSSCDDNGEYCYIDTKDGDKEIGCLENNKCLVVPK